MDNGTLALLIPITALLIPVAAIVIGGLIKIARIKAEAAAPRLAGESEARFEALEQEVQNLRQELSETQERLDFTERLLTRGGQEKGEK